MEVTSGSNEPNATSIDDAIARYHVIGWRLVMKLGNRAEMATPDGHSHVYLESRADGSLEETRFEQVAESDGAPARPAALRLPAWGRTQTLVLVAMLGAALAVLGSALPWASVQAFFINFSMSGTDGDGKISLVASILGLAVLASLLIAPGSRRRTDMVLGLGILLSLVCVGVFSYDGVRIIHLARSVPSDVGYISAGSGIYIGLIGSLLFFAASAQGLLNSDAIAELINVALGPGRTLSPSSLSLALGGLVVLILVAFSGAAIAAGGTGASLKASSPLAGLTSAFPAPKALGSSASSSQRRPSPVPAAPAQQYAATEKLLDEAVTVTLVAKGFHEASDSNGDFESYQTYTIGFQNNTAKGMLGVKGTAKFSDLFGDKIKSVSVSYDNPIPAGQSVTWNAQSSFNQFLPQDAKLRDTTQGKIQFSFAPSIILFTDGSKLETPAN